MKKKKKKKKKKIIIIIIINKDTVYDLYIRYIDKGILYLLSIRRIL